MQGRGIDGGEDWAGGLDLGVHMCCLERRKKMGQNDMPAHT